MAEPQEIFVAYESWHRDLARAQTSRGATVVCLDFWVERELKKENIPFVSLRDIVDAETGMKEWWLLAQNVAREWYRLPAMKFFEYDGIRIAEALEPIMELYLSRLFYYTRICTALGKAYPNAQFHIPAFIVKDDPSVGCLAAFERRAVVDAARMAGLQSTTYGRPLTPNKRLFFSSVRGSLLVRVYNALIRLVPRRTRKVYASEYWSNIGPVISQMDDTELVLMEGGELKKIPWRQLLAHRIRFRHPADAVRAAENSAARASEKFLEQWRTAKKEVAAYLADAQAGLDWSPVVEACEYLITYAPRVIADADALRRIMEEERPDVVLQTASVGLRRSYFYLIAHIAVQLKIPSVELQHAVAYADPRPVYSRLETGYLASYGAHTDSTLERLGYARDRLIPAGSPRFDRFLNERAEARKQGKQLFKQLGLDITRPVLLVAVQASDSLISIVAFDSYEMRDLCAAMRSLQKVSPGLQVLFKFRKSLHIRTMREYIPEMFPADSAIAGDEDIFPLLCASDAALCGFSTVLYEAVLAQTPLVLSPWRTFDTYNAAAYAPAAPLAHTAEEAVPILTRIFADSSYRKELLARQECFLKEYSFDGKSSARIAAFLRGLGVGMKSKAGAL